MEGIGELTRIIGMENGQKRKEISQPETQTMNIPQNWSCEDTTAAE